MRRIIFALLFSFAVVQSASAVGVEEWQQTAGPIGGVVSKMISVNGTPFAALYSGGIYSRTGDAWQQIGIDHGLPENRAFDMVVDPTDQSYIYSGMMIACAARSIDAGATWEPLCDGVLDATGADNFSGDTLALDPADPHTVYLAGRGSDEVRYVLRSQDQGLSWEILATFTESYFFNHLVFFHDVMYLGLRSGGVLVSSDRGLNWTTLNIGLEEDGVVRFAIDASEDVLYVATGLFQFNVRQGGALYQLNAAATEWSAISGPEQTTGLAIIDSTLWVGTEDGKIWKENNGELKLQNADSILPGYVSEFAQDNAGVVFAGVGGYGIFSSNDGATWNAANTGLNSMAIREIAVHPNKQKQLYALTWDRLGFYRSTNGGNSYSIVGKENYYLTFATDPQNFQRLYLGGDHTLFEVRTYPKRISSRERTAPGPTDSVVSAIAVHPKKEQMLLAGVSEAVESTKGFGVYRSIDSGVTWKKAKGIPGSGVHSIVYHPKKPNVVYAAAFGNGVYKSTDGGKHFKQIGGEALKYTYRVTIHPKKPNIVVAGSHLFFAGLSNADQISGEYGGLFETRDGGKTWSDLMASIRYYGDDGSVSDDDFEGWKYNVGHMPNYEQVLFDPKNPDVLLVGHHGENVAMTADNGATWTKPATGMIPGEMHNYAYCMGASKNFNRIYACTCGRGIFAGTFSRVTQSIQWDDAPNAEEEAQTPLIRTASQARQSLLRGDDVHDHVPLVTGHTHSK